MTRAQLQKARRLVADALGLTDTAVDECRESGALYEIGDWARHGLALFETLLYSTDGTRKPLRPAVAV